MITKFDIGSAVKKQRKSKKLDQETLGKKIKPKRIAKDTISRIERGTSNYTIDMLFRIAEALECSVEIFFGCQDGGQDREDIFMEFTEDWIKQRKKHE